MSLSSEGFFEYSSEKQQDRIKELERDCADLSVKNQEFFERVKKLASRTPEWPGGYRPRRYFNKDNRKRIN